MRRLLVRLHERIDRRGPDECWPWRNANRGDGYYGRIVIDGKNRLATRTLWQFVHGPIPPGYFICHACDNPSCMNMRHWFLGTPLQNMRDKVAKGRHVTLRGEQAKNSILTAAKVLEIRRRADAGENQPALAREFGIARTTVSGIACRRNWRHVPEADP